MIDPNFNLEWIMASRKRKAWIMVREALWAALFLGALVAFGLMFVAR